MVWIVLKAFLENEQEEFHWFLYGSKQKKKDGHVPPLSSFVILKL